MMANDKIVEALDRIQSRLYADQPDLFGALDNLLNLLQYAYCEHEWETKPMGGDPAEASSTERVTYCKKCGSEAI